MDVSETLVLVPVGGLFAKRGPLGARDAGSPRLVSSGGGRNDGARYIGSGRRRGIEYSRTEQDEDQSSSEDKKRSRVDSRENYEERKQRQSKIGKCGCVWE